MSTTIYLYLKTHNKTGLKYFGKTSKDPFKYKGSGKYWLRHLKVHGYDIATEIILETNDPEEIRRVGIDYSNKWNIVESDEFANLIIENGTGADTSMHIDYVASIDVRKRNGITWKLSDVTKAEQSKAALSYWKGDRAAARRAKLYVGSKTEFKANFIGPPKPRSVLVLNRTMMACPHCGVRANLGNIKRWHLDKCKQNPTRD